MQTFSLFLVSFALLAALLATLVVAGEQMDDCKYEFDSLEAPAFRRVICKMLKEGHRISPAVRKELKVLEWTEFGLLEEIRKLKEEIESLKSDVEIQKSFAHASMAEVSTLKIERSTLYDVISVFARKGTY